LAASSLIILLSEMLKISPKKTIEENKIVKGKYEIFKKNLFVEMEISTLIN
jgi:hypothetical protein